MESFAETERCFERYREKFDFAGAREPGGVDQGWAVDRCAFSVSATVATSALCLRLIEAGHEVKVFIGNPLCRSTLATLVAQTAYP
jgi:hypothetical protein